MTMHDEPIEAWRAGRYDGEVHVWSVALDEEADPAASLAECLSPDERERAALIGTTAERRRYTLSRIALRHVLAGCHGVAPPDLPLRRERSGRPFVEGDHGLSFSLTHSHGLALIAVAAQPVGVDVERVRTLEWRDRIAQRVMHHDTVVALGTLPDDERTLAFIDAWTQREAHVKTLGGGVLRTPDDLPFALGQPADGSVHSARLRSSGALWSIARFVPTEGWRATVTAPGAVRRVRVRSWSACDPTGARTHQEE